MPSALITGANRGLGLEFSRQYFADGWRVYAACRDPASASELRNFAEGSDDKLRILAMEVTDAASIHAAATQLDGQAIDLLLNNAGIIGPRGQTIGNIDYEAWANMARGQPPWVRCKSRKHGVDREHVRPSFVIDACPLSGLVVRVVPALLSRRSMA